MGVAGVVMWGNRRDENTSPQVCRNLNDYMGRKLGPYLKSVQRRVEECSEARCGGRGRCLTAPADAAERLPGSCPGAQRSFTTDDGQTFIFSLHRSVAVPCAVVRFFHMIRVP